MKCSPGTISGLSLGLVFFHLSRPAASIFWSRSFGESLAAGFRRALSWDASFESAWADLLAAVSSDLSAAFLEFAAFSPGPAVPLAWRRAFFNAPLARGRDP